MQQSWINTIKLKWYPFNILSILLEIDTDPERDADTDANKDADSGADKDTDADTDRYYKGTDAYWFNWDFCFWFYWLNMKESFLWTFNHNVSK